jgi:hypothetical protein
VVKSRMQNQVTPAGQIPKYRYSIQGVGVVFKEEGYVLCYSPLAVALSLSLSPQSTTSLTG